MKHLVKPALQKTRQLLINQNMQLEGKQLLSVNDKVRLYLLLVLLSIMDAKLNTNVSMFCYL